MQAIAIARGLSLRELNLDNLFFSLPGLPEEDKNQLLILLEAKRTPYGTDNAYYSFLFRNTLYSFQRRYLERSRESMPIPEATLAKALSILYQMAEDFGSSFPECERNFIELARELGVPLAPTERIENISDLNVRAPLTVSPEGLPQELTLILQRTGFWDLISENVREIFFTPEIIEENYSMEKGGDTNSELRRIGMDFSRNGEMIPLWKMATILVHEAAHISWRMNAPSELQETTPDERNSFLIEARFLEKYFNLATSDRFGELGLTEQLLPNSEEAHEIAREFIGTRIDGLAANYVLGYLPTNSEYNYYVLPSNEFLSAHGLNGLNELDMTVYPTYLSRMLVLMPGAMGFLLKKIGLPENILQAALEILGPVLSGELILEGEYRLANIDQSISGITISLKNSEGGRRNLSAEEASMLEEAFLAIYKFLVPTPDPQMLSSDHAGLIILSRMGMESTTAGLTGFKLYDLDLMRILVHIRKMAQTESFINRSLEPKKSTGVLLRATT
jgi:hypothetical protein